MPGQLERLIAEMEAAGRLKVKWLVCDVYTWWSFCFDVAKKFGIRVAAVWPAAAACLPINLNIPKLTEDGIVIPGVNHLYLRLITTHKSQIDMTNQ